MGDSGKTSGPRSPAPSTVEPQDRAMRSTTAVCIFIALTAIALATDLLTKHYVFQQLTPPEETLAVQIEQTQANALADPMIARKLDSREMLHALNLRRHVCPGLELVLSANKGAVFGMELHESGNVHRLIVSVATLIVTVLMTWWFATSHRKAWYVHLSTALILGGALGNLYDRMASCISLPGMEPILYNVRDFIDCSSVPLPFGFSYVWIFNIADVWLVVGVGMMMLHWLAAIFTEHKHKRESSGSKS
ncbi:MAG: signal peptidase II [bacterium]|nr:signal peptidase II [bacterium]